MSPFLQELVDCIQDLKKVDLKKGSDLEIEKTDHPVGRCSDEIKRLYQMRDAAMTECLKIAGEVIALTAAHFGEPDPPEGFEELNEKYARAQLRKDVLDRLFWTAVRFEFPEIMLKESIGIRKNWTVVWSDPKPPKPQGQMCVEIAALPSDIQKILEHFGKN